MQLPVALLPFPFLGLYQPVYEEVMSREGDRRRAHVVAVGAGQDMRCALMVESTLL